MGTFQPRVPTGSWVLNSAIAKRWEEARLDEYFRAYWPESDRNRFEPLNHGEARPDTPHPYCVFDSGTSFTDGHSGGCHPLEEIQYLQQPIQFNIHTKNISGRTAENLAAELAAKVMAVFDPGTPKLDLAPGAHNFTIADGDQCLREGDEEVFWNIRYTIKWERCYNQMLPTVPILALPAGAVPPSGDPALDVAAGTDEALYEGTGLVAPYYQVLIGGFTGTPLEYVNPPYDQDSLS